MVRFFRICVCLLAVVTITAPAFAVRTHSSATASGHGSRKSGSKSSKARGKAASHKLHGQQAIAPERVTEIQQALIREHYLSGDANGQWDSTTQAAMLKFQQANGWQTKLLPDSRALMKLGLGPDYSKAINATSASFTPPPSGAGTSEQAAGFSAASGVNQ
jgi:peptidoglycan hydrolase-like protein with peptidoglycan-binding domain